VPAEQRRVWSSRSRIPERDDQIANRRKRRGRPIAFDPVDYQGRNVVERCFNKLKQWRGIAMRSDKTARNYHATLCLATTLHWANTGCINTT
jgi:transposase